MTAVQLKSWLGRIAFATGLYRLLFRNRALVVLFHRIDDRFPGDDITCNVADFERHCSFFARYFTVVTLSELVRRINAGEDVGRHLAITFDDGYLDNVRTAAPILERRRLPACFFIATGFIGSERVPWWDEKLPAKPGWMTWDDVRALHARGFELGAHTVNHVDLGTVKGEEARREIAESRERLVKETGARVVHFSYPYGRPEQITEENRRLVRELGFASCSSAHGGTAGRGTNPFRIPRLGVSHYFVSPWHLGFEAMRSAIRGRERTST